MQYIKAKDMITEYLERNNAINNGTVRELCGFTKQQARTTLRKMIDEDIILKVGNGRATKYELRNRVALEKLNVEIVDTAWQQSKIIELYYGFKMR